MGDAIRTWPVRPYKGLNFYVAADALLFCERSEDVEICAALIGNPATKMLLIHGRTGTGKSSFLRAGLLARLLQERDSYWLMEEAGEPTIIFSGADPIASITTRILQELSGGFGPLPSDQRQLAAASLHGAAQAIPRERARALRDALGHITKKLPFPLVLVIDQAEEVLTLTRGDDSDCRAAYFTFLEELCENRFDIKIVIALRTEYYGSFQDYFRVTPNLRVSTIVSGLEQFMLHSVRSVDGLVRVIECPTRNDVSIETRSSGRSNYGFEYEDSLAHTIAIDVLRHCGESSALPVLQIVCSDLFDNLPPRSNTSKIRLITLVSYRDGKKVEGAIERFVGRAITEALLKCGATPSERTIQSWKYLLGYFVARQEGGALTSLQLGEYEFQLKAARAGVKSNVRACMAILAQEYPRLLRRVDSNISSQEKYYRLGHEALAPSLLAWHDKFELAIQEEQRNRTRVKRVMRNSLWIFLGAVALGVVLVSYLALQVDRRALDSTVNNVKGNQSSRVQLLQLASLLRSQSWVSQTFLQSGFQNVQEQLRSTVLNAPILSMIGLCANTSMNGQRLVVVSVDREVREYEVGETAAKGAGFLLKSDALDGPETFPQCGFIGGLRGPVVFSASKIYGAPFSRYDYKALHSEPRNLLAQFVGDGLYVLEFPGLPGGLLQNAGEHQPLERQTRKVAYDAKSSKMTVTAVQESPEYISYGGPGASFRLIVNSSNSDVSASLRLSAKDSRALVLRMGSRFGSTEAAAIEIPVAGDLSKIRMALLPEGRELAYLDGSSSVQLYTVDGTGETLSARTLHIVGAAKMSPLRIGNGPNSSFAAVHIKEGYRVAWLSDMGIEIVESGASNGGALVPRPDSLQVPGTGVPISLRFSNSGDLLILLTQEASGVGVNVWNVSPTRGNAVERASSEQLTRWACKMTGSTNEGNKLVASELTEISVFADQQPCKGELHE